MYKKESLCKKELGHWKFKRCANTSNYSRTLIGASFWSIGEQTNRWRHKQLLVSLLHKISKFYVAVLPSATKSPNVPHFCSYYILTSSVIYYWGDTGRREIYLLNILFYRCYIFPKYWMICRNLRSPNDSERFMQNLVPLQARKIHEKNCYTAGKICQRATNISRTNDTMLKKT